MLGGDGDILPATSPDPMEDSKCLFSKYLLSPSFFTETEDFIAVKLINAKGEPFYLFDPSKNLSPQGGGGAESSPLCGVKAVTLAPYNSSTECSDVCEGLPEVHTICEDVAESLFKKLNKKSCLTIEGLVFVSDVSMQFFFFNDGKLQNKIYRVASDSEGDVEATASTSVAREEYPVPYILVSQDNICKVVENLIPINASLIDSLCRLEYHTLHEAETFPEDLNTTLGGFMSRHSHTIRGLLETQVRGSECDDPFILRQRKFEIDQLVRLMMKEIDLITQLSKLLENLIQVQNAVDKCLPAVRIFPERKSCNNGQFKLDDVEADPLPEDASSIQSDEDDDPLLQPLIVSSRNDEDKPNLLDELNSVEDSFSSSD